MKPNLPLECLFCLENTASGKTVTEVPPAYLRLSTNVGFFRQNGLILSEVFCIWKGARIMKKI